MAQLSDDGYWQFVDGQWTPTEKQLHALADGAAPYNPESSVSNKVEQIVATTDSQFVVVSNNYQHKIQEQKFSFGRKSIIAGTGVLVIVVTLIILFSTLSPGTISLLDEIRDSDGDGITDYDELEMGTNPELRDSDNDNLDDDEDDCPIGEVDWESNLVSDWDGDGCQDSLEDDDDDNDGIIDSIDRCDTSEVGWVSTADTDNDADGCHDDGDTDDDNDGWSDVKELQCGTNPLSESNKPADFDGDMICDIVDSDDDDDGVDDAYDPFPYDSSEWADYDEDGIGDNADLDDDNDGIHDIYDANDRADVGIILTFDYFELFTNMDWLDSTTEMYACVFIESVNSGCGPDNEGQYWLIETYTYYSLDSEFYIDIDDTIYTNSIQICVWDSDYSADDRIDINPSSGNDCYFFDFASGHDVGYSDTIIASGVGDSTGYDGELTFSYELIDLRIQRFNEFYWDYDGDNFSLTWDLDYSVYADFKNLDHTVDYDDISTYARFATPGEQYVVDLANELESMAIQEGYTSDLEIAEFVYAFVGDIQYVLDIEGSNIAEYPKYPIEMLWESSGDCEDAAILYISLIEALDYDAMLAVGLVKADSDDEWGGHAWAVVNIPGESSLGTYWWGLGDKSDTKFYFVETTGNYDGSSYIGHNPWYDLDDVSLYDIE